MSKIYWQFPTKGLDNAKRAKPMPARGVNVKNGGAPPTGRTAPKKSLN